ncbi:integrase arm-type DNA-binding domain-containing protein [Bradyrhizobium sp. CSA112]|uniref:tyrosine-type recombinase/integrase n=1 Tax=Bradyrhizobium sp. CSA112 TaxID=2699170 RepID=UPI0023B00A5B|nr:integrase family protein [Bradyrhizobium sp. CSA112]MDE5454867.1 integrase arm-type DNA-binding domain-containing protein [Bradyrhizobium sp. CSA112]
MPTTQAPRLLLTDKAVKGLPYSSGKAKIVRDSKIPGFHLWVGKSTKTFRFQYETPRSEGVRGSTKVEWLGEHPHASADQARAKALEIVALRARGEAIPRGFAVAAELAPALTFKAAWEAYKAAITKESKSIRTIADYQDKFDRHLKAWHDRPLASIKREDVIQEHAAVTERARQARAGQKYASGKYAANGTMRFARAVWNYAKDELETPGLPERNPFRSGKLFHKEKARNTGMGVAELPGWWAELQALPNPIRRELHLFMLLTGLRRTDVLTARWANFDPARPSLRLPSPKGGEDRAFELPLSTAQLECLERVREAGRIYYPEESKTWIFPASGSHVAEVKEEGRQKLSHTGHALRHSFRTLAAATGVDRLRLKILMNHAIDADVTDSYANVPALFASLLQAQEQISQFIATGIGLPIATAIEVSREN